MTLAIDGAIERLCSAGPPEFFGNARIVKILYLHRTQAQGVEGVHIWEMIRAFRSLDHSVRVLAPTGEVTDPSESAEVSRTPVARAKGRVASFISRHVPELVFETLEIAYNIMALARGRKLINAWRCDLVYERYAIFAFAGLLLSRWKQAKWILEVNYTACSPLVRKRSRLLKPLAVALDRQLFCRADKLVAVSSSLREELISKYGVRPEKIIVVPNAADPSRFVPETPAVGRVAGREVTGLDVIGFVGGFYPWHGLDLLVSAFGRLAEAFPSSALMLIGDGPERNRIEAMVIAQGLASRVLFAGRIPHDQLAPYVASFAVGVMPDSNDYGSPMKIFEYMAMGKPVIVPDYPPLLDVVVDHREGRVFRRRDVPSLTDAIKDVLADKCVRSKMGRAARSAVELRHNWRANAVSVLDSLGGQCGEKG